MEKVAEIFGRLVGQEPAKRILAGALKNNKLAQTMIFAGPKGVGRKTAALILARTLHRDDQKNHPDTFVFSDILAEMRDNNKGIKDAVDEMIRFLQLSPIASKFKVALIDNCETLSVSAQNALLKTLEEPRADTILVLTVEDEKRLLPTIVSRSQIVRFGPLKDEDMKRQLPDVSNDILRAAQGSLGFALEMANDPDKWALFTKMQDFWTNLATNSTEDKFKWAEEMKARDDALTFLNAGARVLRNQLLEDPDAKNSTRLARLQETIYQVRDNVNARSAVEVLLLVL